MSAQHSRRLRRWGEDVGAAIHFGTNVVLNTPLVHRIGREKAEKMIEVINEVGSQLGRHSPVEIVQELTRRFTLIGLRVPGPELARFADEISRAETTQAHLGPEHADAEDSATPAEENPTP